MEIRDKNITVVGLGATGEAVTAFLIKRGARVTVTDMAGEDRIGPRAGRVKAMGASLLCGGHRPEVFDNADWIVISPGVPHTIEPVRRAVAKGVRMLGEIELAARFIDEPIVAVTGTNGKTTTTTMIGEMLAAAGIQAFVGGNIGLPLIGYADAANKAAVVVAEISSFQLDTIETFRPQVGVLLNIAEDHLDRYADFEAYARSKGRLFENQTGDDVAIVNAGDLLSRQVTQAVRSRKRFFGSASPGGRTDVPLAARVTDTQLVFEQNDGPQDADGRTIRFNRSEHDLYGHHNWENAAAAGLAVLAAGGSPEGIRKALANFKGLAHRLERVGTFEGVAWFNDSKATNVAAVQRALACFRQPVVLILGGRNKDCDFNRIKETVRRHVKQVIAMGEARREIEETLATTVPVQPADSMADAVRKASKAAYPGDIVLLSPACTSFDMYDNYAERGEDFKMEVRQLSQLDS